MHIQSLEDTIVTLSDNEDDTIEYKKAKRMASNIKRKRKTRKDQDTNDSDTSKEQHE